MGLLICNQQFKLTPIILETHMVEGTMHFAAVALHAHHAGLLEPMEMPRNQRLTHSQSARELRDGEFAARELPQNAESCAVAQRSIIIAQFF